MRPAGVRLVGFVAHPWPSPGGLEGTARLPTLAGAVAGYVAALVPAAGVEIDIDGDGAAELLSAAAVPSHPTRIGGLHVHRMTPAAAARIAASWPSVRSLSLTCGCEAHVDLRPLASFTEVSDLRVHAAATPARTIAVPFEGAEALARGMRRLVLVGAPIAAPSLRDLCARGAETLKHLAITVEERWPGAEVVGALAGLGSLRELNLQIVARPSTDRGRALLSAASGALGLLAPRLERLAVLVTRGFADGADEDEGSEASARALIDLARAARGPRAVWRMEVASASARSLVALARELDDRSRPRPPEHAKLVLMVRPTDGFERVAPLFELASISNTRMTISLVAPTPIRDACEAMLRGWLVGPRKVMFSPTRC